MYISESYRVARKIQENNRKIMQYKRALIEMNLERSIFKEEIEELIRKTNRLTEIYIEENWNDL